MKTHKLFKMATSEYWILRFIFWQKNNQAGTNQYTARLMTVGMKVVIAWPMHLMTFALITPWIITIMPSVVISCQSIPEKVGMWEDYCEESQKILNKNGRSQNLSKNVYNLHQKMGDWKSKTNSSQHSRKLEEMFYDVKVIVQVPGGDCFHPCTITLNDEQVARFWMLD